MTDQQQPQENDTIYRRMGQQDILPNAVKYQHLDTSIMGADGWMDAQELWRYSSASGNAYTITVPSDATLKYSIGDKVKLTQDNITTSYFYITAVTSNSLTLNGGSGYSITNKSINEAYYSKINTPLGFPQWFNWSPTLSWDGTPPNTIASQTMRFNIIGRMLNFYYDIVYTNAGVNNQTLTITYMPVASKGTSGVYMYIGTGLMSTASDATIPTDIRDYVTITESATPTLVQKTSGVLAIKSARASGFYEI